MAKFEKFNPVSHVRGLALAAKALKEELDRTTTEEQLAFPYGANAPDEEKPVVQRKKVSKRVQ